MSAKKVSRKRSHPVHAPTGKKLNFILFVAIFGIIGGFLLYLRSQAAIVYVPESSGHKASCISVTASKTTVRPGETFTGVVKIKNTGSTAFAPSFGWGLSEYRDGSPIWSAKGNTLSGNIGPQGTATFNLTLKAPSSTGVKSFDWGMTIAYQGYVRNTCGGPKITVMNPPSVSMKLNGKSGNISLVQNKGLSVSWSATNSPTSCRASGTWGGSKPASGSENRTADTKTTGTKSYSLTCSNQVGSSTLTRTVGVSKAPTSGSSGGSSSTPSRPSTGSSSGSSSSGSGSTTQQQATEKPIPPPDPTNFSALLTEESAVELSWQLPEYLGALSGYELERSTDNETWERIGPESLTDQSYTDTSTEFQTTYYYRVRALEASGLTSGYASVETTTGEFASNLAPEGTTLASDDQSVSVFIPKDAIDGEASCNLYNNNDVLPPAEDKYTTLTGPYDIICKDKDGNAIESFKVPVEVTVTENTAYKNIKYYSYKDTWQEVQVERADNSAKFTLQDQTTFVGIGQEKTTPLWVKILIALLIVGGTILAIVLILKLIVRIKQRNAYETQSEDYYRKEHGY
jgi:hypothetical protein